MQGSVPYWGSGGVVDHVNRSLFDEPLVLLGEDGAPFFDPMRDVAFMVDGPVWVNNHIHVLRPRSVDARYLTYSLNAVDYGRYITGSTRDKLTQDDMSDILVRVPAPNEQRQIADFLDFELARLQSLENCYCRMARLQDERKSAYMRELLSARDGSKLPAVPWLASCPAHWRAVPLRYISQIQRGASPRPIDDPIYFDDEGTHAWVRIADVTASQKYLTTTTQRLSALGRSLSVPLEPGELFVSIAGSVGKPMITTIPCCVHDGFVAIRNVRGLKVEFLYHLLLLGDMFRGLGKLGTQLNLNSDTIGSIVVPVPPLKEQDELIARFRENSDWTCSMRSLVERQRYVLRERRQALITAAVTGQIDVSTARGVSV